MPTKIWSVESEYRYYFWQPYYRQYTKLENLIDLKNIFGVYFSQKKVHDYSKPKLPSGYTIPNEKPPLGYGY
ncbi:MAG: hypothetical protein LBT09_15955 [Planctomycetaceae bacterium]|nr:hypothetical protein [Planctomycetaceae bacterium]